MTVNETIDTLTKNGFRAEDKRPDRDYLIVVCKVCNARWSLGIKQGGVVAGGNVLALIDHAGEHANDRD